MYTWFNINAYSFSSVLAEDAGAPELRNPLNSGMRTTVRAPRVERVWRALKNALVMVFA
mgnify:CR=1 FL=1